MVGKLNQKEVLCLPEIKSLKYAETSVTDKILLYIHVSVISGIFYPYCWFCNDAEYEFRCLPKVRCI